MRLQGKIALVTGAGSGIGRAIALRFANDGAYVLSADINVQTVQETVDLIRDAGGASQAVVMDIGNEESVASSFSQLAATHPRLDILINNAGITDRVDFLSMPLDRFEHVIRVNLFGTLLCSQAAARLMILTGGGRIVNLTSVSGQFGGTGRAAYGASKAAIINLTKTMAVELAKHGILVNAIAPGPTEVGRTAHGRQQRAAFLGRLPLKRYGQPEEIAAAAVFLSEDGTRFLTGHVLNVDGGFAASGVLYDPQENMP